MKYRPWGPVDWALQLSGPKQWHFVGSLGTEQRSLASWTYFKQLGILRSENFVEISDVDSEKYRDRTQTLVRERRSLFALAGGQLRSVIQMQLLAELFRINTIAEEIARNNACIVLDITSFPKRFFFPILRTFFLEGTVRNLVLTYTTPESYAPDGEPLYEDLEPWRTLPGFGGNTIGESLWVVSVGFLVESLRRYVGDNPDEKMKLLVPFPAPLSAIRRTWEAIANIENDHSDGRFEKFRVEPLDLSSAFNRILSLAGKPAKSLAFAPLGPKPTSAAMCLYAIQKGSSVHYPQPTVYHPEYSRGVRNNDPASAINAYWIKHEGENLYEI